MPSSPPTVPARVGDFFGVDDAWERPRPPVGRQDVLLAATVAVVGLVSLELVRSVGALDDVASGGACSGWRWSPGRPAGRPAPLAADGRRRSPRPTCSSSA